MKCDGCTMCCKLLNIEWMDSPAGEYCKECEPGKGCRIYDNAPKKCLEFRCAYNQVEKSSINMRPDKCGVIFERIPENIFIGTVDPDIKNLNDDVRGQIQAFLNEGFSVVLFNQKIPEPFIQVANGRTISEVWDIVKKEIKKIDGSA